MRDLMVVAALCLVVGASGCATKTPLPPSAELPAAAGETKVTRDDNGNSVISLKVEHLAPTKNLQPPKSVYVVWAETPDGQFHNLGQLRVGEDRSGRIKAITPYKTFRVVISPEDFPTPIQPSKPVLRTNLLEAK